MKLLKAIIIDLDGTLTDCEHRRKFVTGEKKDWDAFFEAMTDDGFNEWCGLIMDNMEDEVYTFIVTGRPSNYRDQTMEWLKRHEVIYDQLFMRKEGDFRSDVIVKREIFREHIKPEYEILFTIDDRASVVEMWREEGLVCLQCDKGEF